MRRAQPSARSRVFIFDLDNTLHDASAHVFPQINAAMTRYLEEHLGLEQDQANWLREHYWRRYGATLRGLMRHHGTNPHHFLRETHRFHDLESLLVSSKVLLRALRRLPQRKLLFSNAPAHYVEAVLSALGIARLFSIVHCIEHTGFRPKPHLHGFRRLAGRARLDPRRCVFIDDSRENLRAAKALHMRTVLIATKMQNSPYIDQCVVNPRQFAQLLRNQ
jgi:putative hydrolase of the HAD superfamily